MSTITLSDRVNRIKASPTTAAAARARELKAAGRPIISLTTGEPDFDTPAAIIDGAAAAMRAGQTRYTDTTGAPDLKAAIRAKFKRDNRLDFTSDEVIAGTGAKQVIANALQTLVQEGDEVLIPVPAWVSYLDMAKLAGATPVTIECGEADGFKLEAGALEDAITPATRVLILNSPSNPTGAIYREDELRALGGVLARHPQVFVISDDIYEHLRYTGEAFFTLAQVCPGLKDRVLTVNGVAKAYAMTGWRLGFAGGPRDLIKAMGKLQSQASGPPSSISQAAAAVALNGDPAIVEGMRATFANRREKVVALANAVPGLRVSAPDGAFYLFISVDGLIGRKTPSGRVLAEEADVVSYFLEDGNVATVAGAAFGLSPYLRMSFAAADDLLDEAFERLAGLVGQLN